jgi:hypothetical protein
MDFKMRYLCLPQTVNWLAISVTFALAFLHGAIRAVNKLAICRVTTLYVQQLG